MIYQLTDILRITKNAMGRHHSPTTAIKCRSPDVMGIDDIILSKIPQAVREVTSRQPTEKLMSIAENFGDAGVYWTTNSREGTYSGHVLLPTDFMRLLVFEMSDWETSVTTAISADDALYRCTKSRYAAIRGTPVRPTAAIVPSAEGLLLQFSSCRSTNSHITQALYAPIPRIDEDGGIKIADDTISEVVETIISKIRQ